MAIKNSSYFQTHYRFGAGTEAAFKPYIKIIEKSFGPISRPKAEIAICDIGCSTGNFLHYLYGRGYRRLTGIELDTDSWAFADGHRDGRFTVQNEDALSFIKNSDEPPDVYTFLNVVEHFPFEYLGEILNTLKAKMKKRSLCFMAIPNAGTLYHNHWLYDDATHQGHYTVRSFGQILRTCGWEESQIFFLNDRSICQGPLKMPRLILYFVLLPALDRVLQGKSLNNQYQTPNLIVLLRA